MKSLFLIIMIGLAFTAYSQEKNDDVTILEKMFLQKQITEAKTTQEKEGSKRELIPYVTKKENGFKKYLLTEYDSDGKATNSTYVVSKKDITKEDDLFAIKFRNYPVVSLDNVPENNNAKMKMIVKINGEDVAVTEPFAKVPIKCEEGTELCIDHWTVWYIEETGEIIDIVYEGSDCYQCGGGSGGGGNSTPPDPQLTCEEKTEAYANEGNSMNGPVTEEPEIVISDYERKKPYNWKIYSAGPWGLLSYEEATITRVHYPGTSYEYRWEYIAFTHKRIAAVGMNIGGTRTFEDINSTSNISPTKTKVSVRQEFSVTSNIGGIPGCPPVTIPYNANRDFYCVQVEAE